jgi:hypothetical protein
VNTKITEETLISQIERFMKHLEDFKMAIESGKWTWKLFEPDADFSTFGMNVAKHMCECKTLSQLNQSAYRPRVGSLAYRLYHIYYRLQNEYIYKRLNQYCLCSYSGWHPDRFVKPAEQINDQNTDVFNYLSDDNTRPEHPDKAPSFLGYLDEICSGNPGRKIVEDLTKEKSNLFDLHIFRSTGNLAATKLVSTMILSYFLLTLSFI